MFLSQPRRIALVLPGILICLGLAGCPPRVSDNVTLTQEILYGWGNVAADDLGTEFTLAPLYCDILSPKFDSNPAKPAVLMIHGGSFEGGSRRDEDLFAMADFLASNGYVCFLIDYRLAGDRPPFSVDFFGTPDTEDEIVSTPNEAQAEGEAASEGEAKQIEVPSPAAIHAAFVDAKTAMRFIRGNAEVFEVDPNRVAAFGESAGAFAALAAGVSDPSDYRTDGPDFNVPPENYPNEDPVPNAVVDFWGSADLFLGEFDSSDPPIMVVHGTNDTQFGTFFFSAENIVAECEAHGIPYVFHRLLGEGHGAWEAAVDGKSLGELVLDFLGEYMS